MPDDNETRLKSLLDRTIAGQVVSVVGNASSLLTRNYGTMIDSGCVLRINAGIPINKKAQGRKVDIHCFGTRHNLVTNINSRRRHWLMRRKTDYFRNIPSIWMTLIERELSKDPLEIFYPVRLGEKLENILGARPSTGISVLHMMSELTEARIQIFGFDFKTTHTFYRKSENSGPHDWEAERKFAEALVERHRWKMFH